MTVSITEMANAIRALSMDAVEAANSGHPGMPMGMADVATVLFQKFLKFDPQDPHWPDRDRFVLSAGHGSMLLYSLLHLTGYAHPTIEEISQFRKVDSPCAGHPETHLIAGIEATTGPLGQGLAMAVGMAIAERHLNAEFGDALVDHHTWVIAGDGCLMEGINHEAIGLAGHLKLGRLNVLWDDNNITIDGPASLSRNEDVCERYRAAQWHVVECNGYDHDAIEAALAEAEGERIPDAGPVQDDHRQGCAEQGRDREGPRRGAGCRRGRGGADRAGLAVAGVRGAGRYRRGLAGGRPAGRRCAQGVAGAAGNPRGQGAVRAAHAAASCPT